MKTSIAMKSYTENDLVKLAKRDNNSKRPYLFVNPLQGKHIPVKPSACIQLFQTLAKKLYQKYWNERLLIIGFAETATAIGASLASFYSDDSYYIHTTRELLYGADSLFFLEEHSHATEQRLIRNNLERYLKMTDRIIFAEDEVTTGKTILNMMEALTSNYPEFSFQFGVASILNGMSKKHSALFEEKNISCTYLLKVPAMDSETKLSQYSYMPSLCHATQPSRHPVPSVSLAEHQDPRLGVPMKQYQAAITSFSQAIFTREASSLFPNQDILVLGTEEFMYPALYFASELEKNLSCGSVSFHATTRSPILPSGEEEYPLFSRYQLPSFYDKDRITYIYNLKKYHKVFILHDSWLDFSEGLSHLIYALEENGCLNISVYQWR